MEDSLLAPTSTEDVPRTLRKFKRTRTISYGQEDLVDACEERMVDGGSSPQSQNASYRDRLVGLIRPNNRLGRIGMLNMLMETVVSGAHAFFSVEEKREMHKPWRTALIVKLLGKILGIKALSSKVQQLWRLEGNYKIIDLDNDYFLFKLNRNHIIIMSWNEPSCDKIEFLIAWVHFSKLPLKYYTVMAVWRIVSCVGRVICIDWNTEDVQRGGFARVCIDLDLTKLSCSSVSLGKFGHRKDSCPMSTIAASGTDKVLSSSTHVASDMPSKMPLQLMGTSFGPWMLVQGKTCKPVRDPISNGKSSIGSDFRHDVRRFFALNHAVEDSSNNDKTKFKVTLKDFVKHNKSAGSSKQLVLDPAHLGFLIGPPFDVNITDKAPSNPIVNLNYVLSPLNDVGKLASFVVLKDMATSSTGLVCNESFLVLSSANNVTFGSEAAPLVSFMQE
ncbi:hypothetical protein PVK06_044381 [Gossypium arboreum]|uniref:DUF4283 domain-containing protein n=1 Tax=Gossypium arboreum TaxID=29729 RepID=A0ABR0MRI2_GOSAR|nr:hypothetical protein PVK06_044381 [Gossypium arboreum]